MTSRISTIIRKLLVSTFSCEKPVSEVVLSVMGCGFLQTGAGMGTGMDTGMRTGRPRATVIQVFQAMISMPPRYSAPPMTRTT